MENTACKFCGHQSGDVVLDITDCADTYLDYLDIPYPEEERHYIKCDHCGLVYRTPVLSPDEKEKLYKHFRDQSLRGESAHEYFERISGLSPDKSENHEKYEFLKDYIPGQGTVMDVGAGMGVFLYGFKKYFSDWNVFGVEPTEGVADIAKAHGVELLESYLTKETFPGKTFDLITSIHVLEHTEVPQDYIATLVQYMDEGSLLYIETPSVEDIGFLPKTHDRFMCQHEFIFSQEVLGNLVQQAGLELIYSGVFLSRRERKNLRVLCRKVT